MSPLVYPTPPGNVSVQSFLSTIILKLLLSLIVLKYLEILTFSSWVSQRDPSID